MSSPALVSLGWDATRARAFAAFTDQTLVPARVARVDRGGCDTLTAAGPLRCSYGANVLAEPPCTGDWVAARCWPDDRVTVEAILERRTLLSRLTVTPGQSKSQPLASNVDVVFVAGAVPDPDLGRIERLLAVVWESGARAVVLLTKADLAGSAIDVLLDDVREIAGDAPVHGVSAPTGLGLAELRAELPDGHTAALLGASGVGKSTIANALVGAELLPTAVLRADGKGRHTTVTRELVPLPGGGVLIDTPGLRSIGVNVAASTVDRVFADIEELAAGCRYRDCAHDAEPGCAVWEAIERGELRERRLLSWRKLMREARYERERSQARARAELRRRQKRKKQDDQQTRLRARP
ncbi:MAG: ribosome small subunit-dependent GTPase A [Streptosporangiales bacterium]|nr:ribosome small subunit-dependent GTPase A [Streptosporangiales bacterium]